MCFRIASDKQKKIRIASDLGMCDSNRIAHRGCIARFGPLSLRPFPGNEAHAFFLGAQNGVFWVGAKSYVEKVYVLFRSPKAEAAHAYLPEIVSSEKA